MIDENGAQERTELVLVADSKILAEAIGSAADYAKQVILGVFVDRSPDEIIAECKLMEITDPTDARQIKKVDEMRRSVKAMAVSVKKTTADLREAAKGYDREVKEYGEALEGKLREAQAILDERQKAAEKVKEAADRLKCEEIAAKLVHDHGFIIVDDKYLRYGGNQSLEIYILHKLSADQIAKQVSIHADYLEAEKKRKEEAEQLAAQKKVMAKEKRELLYHRYASSSFENMNKQSALDDFWQQIWQVSDDAILFDDKQYNALILKLNERHYVAPKPEKIAARPVTPEEAFPSSAENVGSDLFAAKPEQAAAPASSPEPEQEMAPPVVERKAPTITRVEYRGGKIQPVQTQEQAPAPEVTPEPQAQTPGPKPKLHEVLRGFRVKVGNTVGVIVFEDSEAAMNAINNAGIALPDSGHDATEYYGGLLLCESVLSIGLAEMICDRWNSFAD